MKANCSEPPLGAGRERLAERREDRQIDDSVLVFSFRSWIVPSFWNVLAAEPRRVADPEARVEQDRIDEPLVRAERIGALELREFLFAPCLVAILFVDAGFQA